MQIIPLMGLWLSVGRNIFLGVCYIDVGCVSIAIVIGRSIFFSTLLIPPFQFFFSLAVSLFSFSLLILTAKKGFAILRHYKPRNMPEEVIVRPSN